MKNTLNNVIETLESKGYMVEYDATNTVLEIEKEINTTDSAIIDVTPIFVYGDTIEDTTIDEIINEDTQNICFEFYGFTLNFPSATELIKEIEESMRLTIARLTNEIGTTDKDIYNYYRKVLRYSTED